MPGAMADNLADNSLESPLLGSGTPAGRNGRAKFAAELFRRPFPDRVPGKQTARGGGEGGHCSGHLIAVTADGLPFGSQISRPSNGMDVLGWDIVTDGLEGSVKSVLED